MPVIICRRWSGVFQQAEEPIDLETWRFMLFEECDQECPDLLWFRSRGMGPVGTITLCDLSPSAPNALRTLLLRNKIATLDELKQALADCRWKQVRSEPMYWNC